MPEELGGVVLILNYPAHFKTALTLCRRLGLRESFWIDRSLGGLIGADWFRTPIQSMVVAKGRVSSRPDVLVAPDRSRRGSRRDGAERNPHPLLPPYALGRRPHRHFQARRPL